MHYCIMHVSCNACKSGKLTFFNTAIYIYIIMNDMTCTNEMQHGLLEQNTRFKHSSVITVDKLGQHQFQCHYVGALGLDRQVAL